MRAKKHFGQNFLQDTAVINRIVSAFAPSEHDSIIEIGPGRGALTIALFSYVSQLTAIEIDRDLIPMLTARCVSLGDLTLVQADVLTVDFIELAAGKPLRIIGNLPYNIATPLLFNLLKQLVMIKDMHFMLQKEVVDRIVAQPGNKTYGRLSVIMQYHCKTSRVVNVPADAFEPIPKVESAVLRLVPHVTRALPADTELLFSEIVKAAFSQRRKTLRNTLKTYLTPEDWQAIDIDPVRRAETLAPSDFVTISKYYREAYGNLCDR